MTSSGGQTAKVSRQPVMVRTSQNGIMSESRGQDPPGGGAERLDVEPGDLAQGQDRRADRPPGHRRRVGDQAEQGRLKRLEPQPTRNAAEIATGAPNPAAPSMNAPNEKATSTAWSRRSPESRAIDAFITSNCPVATAMS